MVDSYMLNIQTLFLRFCILFICFSDDELLQSSVLKLTNALTIHHVFQVLGNGQRSSVSEIHMYCHVPSLVVQLLHNTFTFELDQ